MSYKILLNDIKEIFKKSLSGLRFDHSKDWQELTKNLFPDSNITSQKNFCARIQQEIRNLISKEDGLHRKYIIETTEQLFFEQTIEGAENSEYISILNYIFDSLNEKISDTELKLHNMSNPNNDPDNWINAILWADLYSRISQHDYSTAYISDNKQTQARAIKYLLSQGFKINYKNNVTSPSLPDKQIVKRIEKLIESVGRLETANLCVTELNKTYRDGRFIIGRNSNWQHFTKPTFPYLYLLNLSIKNINLHIVPATKQKQANKQRLQNLVSNYMFCYDTEQRHPFIHLEVDDLSEYLFKTALFDFCFIPKQFSPPHYNVIWDALSNWIEGKDKDLSDKFKEYNNLLRLLIVDEYERQKPSGLLTIDKNLPQLIIFKEVIDELSVSSDLMNKNYTDPNTTDFKYSDSIYFNPIITTKDKLIILHPNIFAYALFERMYALVRSKDKKNGETSTEFGYRFEEMVEKSFENLNITGNSRLFINRKYPISKDLQDKYSFDRDNGEIDILLETDKDIFIFELKLKPFTMRGMLGNPWFVLKDLRDSLFKPIEQMQSTNILLKGEKSISLDTGESILINGRQITNIAITFFEYGAFQNPTFIHNFYGLIANGIQLVPATNNEQENKEIKKFNDLITQIQNQIITLNDKCNSEFRETSMSTISLNFSVLLSMIADSKGDVKNFVKRIRTFSRITFGPQESNFAYHHMKHFIS
jgi:hypothetical protein